MRISAAPLVRLNLTGKQVNTNIAEDKHKKRAFVRHFCRVQGFANLPRAHCVPSYYYG